MTTQEQQAVVRASRLWLSAQIALDGEYRERLDRNVIINGPRSDRKTFPRRFHSQEQVELNAKLADQKLGPILAGFTYEQMSEYMRLTTK